ncbi:MAG: DUF364 domain-containing protein [Bacteroidales bacterium]|nr:DUF364 domain-containing protein [Bacteroidales bacterium]MDD3665904.1 DUF364 domain-containing protein [Bacteroidales bacterium]
MNSHSFPDPLTRLYEMAGMSGLPFQRLEFGTKYCSVMLADGQSGVCATLGVAAPAPLPRSFVADFKSPSGRVIAMAALNAALPTPVVNSDQADVVEAAVASGFSHVVMIGLFRPLIEPLRAAGIRLSIFDLDESTPLVRPAGELGEAIKEASLVVVTATSIANNTFAGIMNGIPAGLEVWMLGPSTPLSEVLLREWPLTRLFGTRFPVDCHSLHDLVAAGKGTRSFIHLGQKVSLIQ